jgi:bacteriorhodopsin
MNFNIYISLIISITIQILTGVIEIGSLFIKLPSKFVLLKEMMLLELFVQIVEGAFYVYWLYNFKSISNITPNRYLDWVITTPTMLVNLIFYLIFLQYINNYDNNNNSGNKLNFFDLFKQEFYTIITVLLLNWLMLLFGYLSEISMIPLLLGVSLGFIPFLIYYYIIYDKYALLSEDGLKIFLYFFIFWSLYGVAAVLPYKIKNTLYNILDLFSKNFFGIFLTYLIFTNRY